MRKIWAVALKEIRQTRRDPLSLLLLFGIPTLMLLLYGYALNFDVRHVRIAVADRSQTAASRAFIAAFVRSSYFDVVATPAAGSDLEWLTAARVAKAVLVIPEDFATALARGPRGGAAPAEVQLLLDGSDATTAATVLVYAEALTAAHNAQRVSEAAGVVSAIALQYEPRVWFNPELRSTQFLVPGLIGFILMLTAVLSTAMSVVREKERGTMEQLRVTALGPGQLIIGKTLPYLGISLGATVLILVAARLLFGVVVKGPYLDLFVATFVYLLGALGFGLLVSSVSDSQAMAFQLGSVTSMLPAIFLSGFVFPIRGMPEPLQWLTYAVPARYFLVVLRGVILKGSGLLPYGRDMAFLCLYAALVLGVAYVRLTRREA